MKEKDRGGQTDRDRERENDREKQRKTQRETETKRHTDRQTETQIHISAVATRRRRRHFTVEREGFCLRGRGGHSR